MMIVAARPSGRRTRPRPGRRHRSPSRDRPGGAKGAGARTSRRAARALARTVAAARVPSSHRAVRTRSRAPSRHSSRTGCRAGPRSSRRSAAEVERAQAGAARLTAALVRVAGDTDGGALVVAVDEITGRRAYAVGPNAVAFTPPWSRPGRRACGAGADRVAGPIERPSGRVGAGRNAVRARRAAPRGAARRQATAGPRGAGPAVGVNDQASSSGTPASGSSGSSGSSGRSAS